MGGQRCALPMEVNWGSKGEEVIRVLASICWKKSYLTVCLVFESYVCVCVWCAHSVMSDSFQPPWTVAYQAPLSMGFPRQEYWSRLSFPLREDLPDPKIKSKYCRRIPYLQGIKKSNMVLSLPTDMLLCLASFYQQDVACSIDKSLSLLCNIPLCKHTTVYTSILLSSDFDSGPQSLTWNLRARRVSEI